jgi:hypothetical protein
VGIPTKQCRAAIGEQLVPVVFRGERADIALVQRVTAMTGEGMTLAGIRRILAEPGQVRVGPP